MVSSFRHVYHIKEKEKGSEAVFDACIKELLMFIIPVRWAACAHWINGLKVSACLCIWNGVCVLYYVTCCAFKKCAIAISNDELPNCNLIPVATIF